jgi:hypothetical protein
MFKRMLKLSFSFDSVRFILLQKLTEWVINCLFCFIFLFLKNFNTFCRTGGVGVGAASRYGAGSDKIMRLLTAPIRLRNTSYDCELTCWKNGKNPKIGFCYATINASFNCLNQQPNSIFFCDGYSKVSSHLKQHISLRDIITSCKISWSMPAEHRQIFSLNLFFGEVTWLHRPSQLIFLPGDFSKVSSVNVLCNSFYLREFSIICCTFWSIPAEDRQVFFSFLRSEFVWWHRLNQLT